MAHVSTGAAPDDDAADAGRAGAEAGAPWATSDGASGEAVRRAFAEEWAGVVATLIRLTGDWSLAEDCAQEAFAAAHVRWADDGVPQRPGAWLTTVARNRARDRLRRRAVEQRRVAELAALADRLAPDDGPEGPADDDVLPDDRLRLVFTCCHPALPVDAQVALTLRTVCGLTVGEIARAFRTSEPAMAKRLVRTRGTIAHARIPYRVPQAHQLAPRLAAVLAVVYLVFTEGYAATSGASPVRTDLCAEAIRLGRLLADLLPGEPEVHAALALMLLHDARRPARVGHGGSLVPLDEQDRDRWDRGAIDEGVRALRTAQGLAAADAPYLLQAEIAACHSTASAARLTPWVTVVHLYDRLLVVAPSPHARLARAVAVGMAEGPDVGLADLRGLVASGAVDGLAAVPAAEADLLRRAGRLVEAVAAYERAVAAAQTDAERGHLLRRLAEVSAADGQLS
ncbi:sigma-70 family RNA polymerase sigma factor [Actinotalea sp.]|uniref:RNA polymerase sigma factor n=1 Tax=Actinotalea sp. TaxID=1872145 RepID=UPI002BCA2691|nr:sigma-70 family RNA polymerase sigma factor [Actinotalea sp.]HRA49794.1 sigma-70 family RNA polymerase sigma factor [Actinotalea sp.]